MSAMTETQMTAIALKLYKLQFDPYKQCEMFGEDGVVWNVMATTTNGETKKIDLTNNHHDCGSLDNPFVYALFNCEHGYQRLHWEDVAEIDGIKVH